MQKSPVVKPGIFYVLLFFADDTLKPCHENLQELAAHHESITVIPDHKRWLVRSFFRLAEMHDSSGRIPCPNPAWPPMHRRHIPLHAVSILSE